MRYWIRTAFPVENGTLLREETGQVPEVLRRDTLEWTATPSLYGATSMTADWDPISEATASQIEQLQRARALADA